MLIYIITLLSFLLLVCLVLKRTNSTGILRMALWVFIAYSFLILTHIFSGIAYYSGKIERIFPYFIACLLLLVLGEYLGAKITTTRGAFIKIKPKTLAYISSIGAILQVFDIYRLNEIIFATRIIDFQISPIGVVGSILSSIGLISWLSGLYEYCIHNIEIRYWAYLSILSYIAGGILTAGRQSIIIITLSSLVMFLWSRQKRKELGPEVLKHTKKPVFLVVIASLFIIYFLVVPSVRSLVFDTDNKISMLEYGFNAKISESTTTMVHHMGPLSDIYIESLFYYSHQLRHLDLLNQYYDHFPLFGLAQLHYLERRVQWLIGEQNEICWRKVEDALEQKGAFDSHSWGTFIAGYILDFGRIGTLILCFFTGFIIGILYKNLKENESKPRFIRHCILLSGVIFSIQFSPLAELTWTSPLILSSFINPSFQTHRYCLLK